MGGVYLEGSEVSFTQYVDMESGLVDEAVLVLFFGGEAMGFTVDFEFDISIQEYGGSYSVAAPESATPLSEILAGMGLM